MDERLAAVSSAPRGAHLAPPDARVIEREGWWQIVTPSVPSPGLNEIVCARLDADLEPRIDAAIAAYRDQGLPWKWVVGPDSAPEELADLVERRAERSWEALGMVAEPQAALALCGAHAEVQEARDDAGRSAFCSVWREGWDLDGDWLEDACSRARDAGTHRFYVARIDGEPAGVAAAVRHPGSDYLTGAVVLERFRRRGLYRALLSIRLQDAVDRGVALVTTQARAATSAPILERLGFETVCRLRCFSGT